ncbi:MAG: hypothetical protein EOO07_15155 [Chitinophagaceae bacterium]|nr:MAG: hypothetical protein EOO07_15155 [Chitinophagaceae bacterium]
MKYFQWMAIVALTYLFASSSQATNNIPNDFRGLKWGSAPSSNLKKLPGPTSDETATYIPSSQKSLLPFFTIAVSEEAYSFSHGKFYSGSLWIEGKENLEKVKDSLIKEFGKPSFENEKMSIWKWKWKWPLSKIEIKLYHQVKSSKTTVTYTNNAF